MKPKRPWGGLFSVLVGLIVAVSLAHPVQAQSNVPKRIELTPDLGPRALEDFAQPPEEFFAEVGLTFDVEKTNYKEIEDLTFPVLVPKSRPFLENVVFYKVSDFQYSASSTTDGIAVEIVGTTVAYEVPVTTSKDFEAVLKSLSLDFSYDPEMQLAESTVTIYGIPYIITVECMLPGDQRCANPGFTDNNIKNKLQPIGKPKS